jgi:hypothetical protein
MDHYNGITNEEFKEYYLIDLHSRMELTQYTYPHEFIEPDKAIDDHIIRCQNILKDYIKNLIKENSENLTEEQLIEIYEAKRRELYPVISTINNDYYEKVKVNYIQL